MPSQKQLLDIIAIQTEISKLGLDLGGTMALVVDRILPLIGADGAAIELAEGDEMVYRAASGIAAPQLGLRLSLHTSLSGLCVRSDEILNCNDCEQDPRVDLQACRQVGLRSMIVVPLKHGNDSVGVLKAMSRFPNQFGPGDITVVKLLSEVIAAAMYFATKYSDDELFHKATHDAMTGLANRALFVDRVRSAIARYERCQQPAIVLIIDMDGLKRINDTFGHRMGDVLITEFANRLKSCARHSDTVARLGGDEFGFILSPIEMPGGLPAILQRITAALAPPLAIEQQTHVLQASIGAAEFPHDGQNLEHLLEIADQRMYRMKKARNTRSALNH